MNYRLVTAAIVLTCLYLFFFTKTPDNFFYHRQINGEPWRLITATFSHYDLRHLAINLAVFVFLASQLEKNYGSVFLLLTITVTSATTMALVHYWLHNFSRYAGLSGLNYALLGAWIGDIYRTNRWLAFTLLGLLLAFAVVSLLMPTAGLAFKPVQEVHALGFILGIGMLAIDSRIKRFS